MRGLIPIVSTMSARRPTNQQTILCTISPPQFSTDDDYFAVTATNLHFILFLPLVDRRFNFINQYCTAIIPRRGGRTSCEGRGTLLRGGFRQLRAIGGVGKFNSVQLPFLRWNGHLTFSEEEDDDIRPGEEWDLETIASRIGGIWTLQGVSIDTYYCKRLLSISKQRSLSFQPPLRDVSA